MKSPTNEGERERTTIFCYQIHFLVLRLGYILVTFLSKWSHGNPQPIQACCKTEGNTYTIHQTWKRALCLHEPSCSHSRSLAQESTWYQKKTKNKH